MKSRSSVFMTLTLCICVLVSVTLSPDHLGGFVLGLGDDGFWAVIFTITTAVTTTANAARAKR